MIEFKAFVMILVPPSVRRMPSSDANSSVFVHLVPLPSYRLGGAGLGHLQRMDSTGAVSGPIPIAAVLLWPATHAPVHLRPPVPQKKVVGGILRQSPPSRSFQRARQA
jgi:hypothetical protein